jgi:hypothetical protein
VYVIYLREAHPNRNRVPDPQSLEERRTVAREFAEKVKLSVPVLVDTMDDQVNRLYAGWPDRLYVIDAEGQIALKGGPGPGGFAPAVRGAPAVLDKLLAATK